MTNGLNPKISQKMNENKKSEFERNFAILLSMK